MENEIRVQKTTLLLLVGLLVAISIGAYVVWGAAVAQKDGSAVQASQQGLQAQETQQTRQGQAAQGGTPQEWNGQEVQDVYVRALGTGTYDKEEITVKKGIPVRFHFTAESSAGCGKALVIPAFDVSLVSRNGEEVVTEFTPAEAGTYEYSCTMRMFRGRLVVQ